MANAFADFDLGLTCRHEGGAQLIEGLNLIQSSITKNDAVLSPEMRLGWILPYLQKWQPLSSLRIGVAKG